MDSKYKALADNFEWTSEQISLFLLEAKSKPAKRRSGYYKAVFLFLASMVEAIAYFAIKKLHDEGLMIEHRYVYKNRIIHTLPKEFNYQTPDQDKCLVICEKVKSPFKWDESIDFQSLNEIGKKYKIFTDRFHKKLESIRKKRNRIHMQTLKSKDHKYTKKDTEYVASALPPLVKLLKT